MPVHGRGPLPSAAPSSSHIANPTRGPALIREYRSLSRFANSAAALTLLQSIGRTVTPLMARYKWRVPLLAEFLPSNPNLLGINVNRGAKINLRLRWDGSRDELIDEKQVTLVMLHELVHNVHGPHDERFYALLDTITEEYYEARRKGRWEGEGFLSEGRKLGGAPHSRIPPAAGLPGRAGSGTLAAAPQRLGGSDAAPSSSNRGRISVAERRKRAAEAAERRRRDAAACPDSVEEINEVTQDTERRERGQGVDVIVIDDDDDDDDGREQGAAGGGEWEDEIVFTGKREGLAAPESSSSSGTPIKIELDDVLRSAPSQNRPSARPHSNGGTGGGDKEQTAARHKPIKTSRDDAIVISSSSSSSSDEGEGSVRSSRTRPPPAKRSRSARPSADATAMAEDRSGSSRTTLQTRAAAALAHRNSVRDHGDTLAPSPRPPPLSLASLERRQWTCQACTLLNPTASMSCAACGLPRPSINGGGGGGGRAVAATPRHREDEGEGWTCHACGYRMRDGAAAFWSCAACGQVKRSSEAGSAGWGAVLGGGGY